ncbi:hypothetical protein EX30DRAFT_19324 [Ascodesmis nigricans]|uniref:Calcineurin-like phosphoesterase domain-containing protein n=1 Tax=Ascodesmis nigricans TaxID=341454 RepID=A0A4S2N7G5_9PEZI|nr:hypothetical protein EX30DRAFT_19324 [Ascodesmis nigricans]
MSGLLPTSAARARSPSPSLTSPHLYRPKSTSRIPAPTPLLQLLSFLGLNPNAGRFHRLRTHSSFSFRSLITPVTLILLPLWLLLILHTEHWTYTSHLRACDWDKWEKWPAGATPHRLALVADPQLVDIHTYSRRGPALWATIFYTDLYLRRNWDVLHSDLLPLETVFLGDLFDGGREWGVATHKDTHSHDEVPIPQDPKGEKDWKSYGNSYWFNEYARFLNVFSSPAGIRSYRSLPGNHDLGFGTGVKRSVRERFEAYLGDTNRVWRSGNHTFVAIDTVSLSNENDAAVFGPSKEFLESLSATDNPDAGGSALLNINTPAAKRPFPHTLQKGASHSTSTDPAISTKQLPTILLTHVPLYRSASTPCGPLRERGTSIPIWKGYQYQNVLSPELSQKLLTTIDPRYVFSGDDHDACEVTHSGMVKEVTVKSASWAMGVRRPAIYLVSLWNPDSGDGKDQVTLKGKMCLLPDMIGGLLGYVWMLVFSVVVVAGYVGHGELRRKRKGKARMILPGEGGKYAKKKRIGEQGALRKWVGEMAKVVVLVAPLYVVIVWWW